MKDNEWKNIMRAGTAAAHLLYTISKIEQKLLDQSIDKPIDMKFADYDTKSRLMRKLK